MTIEKLSTQTVKIKLNEYELDFFGLSFELLKNNDRSTRKLISYILDEIKSSLNISLFDKKLYIEAFSVKPKCCVLYISFIDDNSFIKIRNINRLSEGIMIISECFYPLIIYSCKLSENSEYPKSSLYYWQNRYLLIINDIFSTDHELPERTAVNFGLEYYTSDILKASAEEYGKRIFSENAVGILSGKISF